ncbi:hypothetical protein GCM10009743_25420 [Kribbella swartbergensis]
MDPAVSPVPVLPAAAAVPASVVDAPACTVTAATTDDASSAAAAMRPTVDLTLSPILTSERRPRTPRFCIAAMFT